MRYVTPVGIQQINDRISVAGVTGCKNKYLIDLRETLKDFFGMRAHIDKSINTSAGWEYYFQLRIVFVRLLITAVYKSLI